jgi:glutathione S-transferase
VTKPVLYIGNKNYSSWSMRPWLAMKWAGIGFDEVVLPLGATGYGKSQIPEILAVSPSGRVPALHVDGVVIYDSIAICEWAHERAPGAQLWPGDPVERALARSAAAEMHAGFAAVRRSLPMNIRRTIAAPPALDADTASDLERIFELWSGLRMLHSAQGPFLFGARSIADAMFAPVVTRLRTYAIETPAEVSEYCAAVLEDVAFKAWEAAAVQESWRIAQAEEVYS